MSEQLIRYDNTVVQSRSAVASARDCVLTLDAIAPDDSEALVTRNPAPEASPPSGPSKTQKLVVVC